MFKKLCIVLSGLILTNSISYAQLPQVGFGPISIQPFQTINVSQGSNYTLSAINSLVTSVIWNSGQTANKALSIPGCTAANDAKTLYIIDYAQTASTYPITVTPTSGTLDGNATDNISISGAGLELICSGSTTNWIETAISVANAAKVASYLNGLTGNNSAASVYYARAYNGATSGVACTWDSSHDVGDCINEAIISSQANGGGVIIIPAGTYGLSTTILDDSTGGGGSTPAVFIQGAGSPGVSNECTTTLKWIGSSGGTMFQMGNNTHSYKALGGGVKGICFDGNDLAGTGWKLLSSSIGLYENDYVKNTTTDLFFMDVNALDAGTTDNNIFIQVNGAANDAASINTNGWHIGIGTTTNDTWGNHWLQTNVQYQNGTGFICGNADHNVVYGGFIQTILGGTGTSLDLQGSNNTATNVCRYNYFTGSASAFGAASVTSTRPIAEGTAGGSVNYTFPSKGNYVFQQLEGSFVAPLINTNATISYESGSGVHFSNIPQNTFIGGTFTLNEGASSGAQAVAGTNVVTTTNTLADPTGTTSTAANVMAGLAQSITPTTTGNLEVTLVGQLSNNTGGDAVAVQLAYGTGTAPVNGAAATGTVCNKSVSTKSTSANDTHAFSITCIITGRALNTAVWWDAQFKAITGGTASLTQLTALAHEE